MTIKWMLQSMGDEDILLVLSPGGEALSATRTSHSNFDDLVDAARAHDEEIYDLFELGKVIEKKFAEVPNVVNGRISVRSGRVFYDDDPLDNAISDKIVEFLHQDEDFSPLARYVENVMANPQEESREQFYRWIANHHFPIADDGTIVAYKSVYSTGDGNYRSCSAGHAFVNGTEYGSAGGHRETIPQTVGDVVTMPRSEVAHDPNVACHTGLHAGTWEYASTFSGDTVMLVKINPRDVVSVPHDSSSQKVRVCRYEVIGFATDKSEALRYVDSIAEGDSDIAEAEAEADPDDEFVEIPEEKPFAGKSKKWRDGDAVIVISRRLNIEGQRGVVRNTDNSHRWSEGSCAVKVGGTEYSLWDYELEADPNGTSRNVGGKVDTRKNHLSQRRGVGGRFLPKGS